MQILIVSIQRFSLLGGPRTLSGYRRFSCQRLLAGEDDTGEDDKTSPVWSSTTWSVGLVRTAGGVRFAGVLGKTGKAQSIGTGGTFSATGEGKLSGRVSTQWKSLNISSPWQHVVNMHCALPLTLFYQIRTAPSLLSAFAWIHFSTPPLKFRMQTASPSWKTWKDEPPRSWWRFCAACFSSIRLTRSGLS